MTLMPYAQKWTKIYQNRSASYEILGPYDTIWYSFSDVMPVNTYDRLLEK